MPINRELFERGLDPLDAAIVEFLDSRPDQAYDFNDIASEFREHSEEFWSRVTLGLHLHSLVQKEFIAAKTLSGRTYYASVRPRSG